MERASARQSNRRTRSAPDSSSGSSDEIISRRTRRRIEKAVDMAITKALAESDGDEEDDVDDDDDDDDDGDDDDGEIMCVCGNNVEVSGGFMLQCGTCNVWQHGDCVGFADLSVVPEEWLCTKCSAPVAAPPPPSSSSSPAAASSASSMAALRAELHALGVDGLTGSSVEVLAARLALVKSVPVCPSFVSRRMLHYAKDSRAALLANAANLDIGGLPSTITHDELVRVFITLEIAASKSSLPAGHRVYACVCGSLFPVSNIDGVVFVCTVCNRELWVDAPPAPLPPPTPVPVPPPPPPASTAPPASLSSSSAPPPPPTPAAAAAVGVAVGTPEIGRLSPEQRRVFDMVVERRENVFVTGRAGSGKSFLVNCVIKALKGEGRVVSVAASTGIAAVHIGGTTLHSFASIGLGNESVPILIRKIRGMSKARTRWCDTDVLIVDEVSMISAQLWDKLDQIGKAVRNNYNQSWGGLQLVAVGDFLQLPPVVKESNQPIPYAFTARCWDECFENQVVLVKSFRQDNATFIRVLNQCRLGYCTADMETLLRTRVIASGEDPNAHSLGMANKKIVPTRLYPYRKNVAQLNNSKLLELRGARGVYTCVDWHSTENRDGQYALQRLQLNCPATESLELRVGAQVMLLKNLDFDCHLVNGSRGTVVGFVQNKPSWQEDATPTDWLSSSPPSPLTVDSFVSGAKAATYTPIVEFANGVTRRIHSDKWETEVHGLVIARRSQLPLTLAWALTIHKCQGMSLDCAQMSLAESFAPGQVYVALSRLRTLDGLVLESFDTRSLQADNLVIQYYEVLHFRNHSDDSSFEERRRVLYPNSTTTTQQITRQFESARRAMILRRDAEEKEEERLEAAKKNKKPNVGGEEGDDGFRQCPQCMQMTIPQSSPAWKTMCSRCYACKMGGVGGGGGYYNRGRSNRGDFDMY